MADRFVRILIQHVRNTPSGFMVTGEQPAFNLKTEKYSTEEVAAMLEDLLQESGEQVEVDLRKEFLG